MAPIMKRFFFSLHVENLINLFLSKRTANYKALRIIIAEEKIENENGQRRVNLISFIEEASKRVREDLFYDLKSLFQSKLLAFYKSSLNDTWAPLDEHPSMSILLTIELLLSSLWCAIFTHQNFIERSFFVYAAKSSLEVNAPQAIYLLDFKAHTKSIFNFMRQSKKFDLVTSRLSLNGKRAKKKKAIVRGEQDCKLSY